MPKLVDEVNGLVDATPGYVEDLTEGRGRLGFLERKYQIVEKVQEQVNEGDAPSGCSGFSDTAVAVTKGVLTLIVATVTIVFLTFFLLLEGGAWVERFYGLLPERSQPRWRRHRRRHPQDDRRLRHRQPADQPRRRRHVHDRAARRWACRSPSRSGCSSRSST